MEKKNRFKIIYFPLLTLHVGAAHTLLMEKKLQISMELTLNLENNM